MKIIISIFFILCFFINFLIYQSYAQTINFPINWTDEQKFFIDHVIRDVDRLDQNLSNRFREDVSKGKVVFINADSVIVSPGATGFNIGYLDWRENAIKIPHQFVSNFSIANETIKYAQNKLKSNPNDAVSLKAIKKGKNNLEQYSLDFALTIVHEYVHMDQNHPQGIPEHEDPAWMKRLDKEAELIENNLNYLEILLNNQVNTQMYYIKVEDTKNRIDLLMKIHQETINATKDPNLKTITKKSFDRFDNNIKEMNKKLKKLLEKKLSASTIPVSPPTPSQAPSCTYQYTDWGKCNPATNKQTHSLTKAEPQGCVERQKPVFEQNCILPPSDQEKRNAYLNCACRCSSGWAGHIGVQYDPEGKINPEHESVGPCIGGIGSFGGSRRHLLAEPNECMKGCYEGVYGPGSYDAQAISKINQATNQKFILPLQVTLTGPELPAAFGTAISVTAQPQGGRPPYRFQWTGAVGQDAQAQAIINRLQGVSVSVTVTDADGRQARANLTLKAALLKLTLNGAAGQVIYGTQAGLSVNGAGLPTVTPDPCAGRTGNTRNPFDECNEVRIDKMAPAAKSSAASRSVDVVLAGDSDPDAPPSPAAAPRYRYLWHSSPGLTFEPGTSDNGQTTVTYDRMGPVKVWCEIQQMLDGAWQTIGETDQTPVTVAAPAFALRFTPDNGQARMGQEVRVQIITNPDIPARLIDYRWFDPVSRMEYATNSSHIGFTVKDAKPMPLKALARVPHYGDDIAEITGSYSGQGYDIKISAPRPWGPQLSVWVCDTQLGKAADCGMKPIPSTQFVTFQDIFLEAQITPVPPTARYRWSIDPSGSCGQPGVAREIRINCSNTGSYTVGLQVYDAENRLLGQAEPRAIKIAINGEAVKKAPQLKTAWENMQQAKQRVNTGQLEEAIELGIAAAQLDPNNAEAKELTPRWVRERQTIRQYLAQAKKALQANRLDDAEKAVDAARKLHPSYPPTRRPSI